MNQIHRTMANSDLFDKAEWEGGMYEYFFNYGVDPMELNEPYATLLDNALLAVGELEDALKATGWDNEDTISLTVTSATTSRNAGARPWSGTAQGVAQENLQAALPVETVEWWDDEPDVSNS